MFRYDPIFIKRKSTELYFVKDTFEKVSRLIEILKFINTFISLGKLSLKVETAINLTILREFSSGSYIPELLFMDQSILDRIMTHPMALWKTNK